MSRKLKTKILRKRMEVSNNTAIEETALENTTSWDFGSIALTCKCGRTQTLMEHVQYGIQFIITTNNKSGVTLHCDKCHSELRLHCIEGEPEPDAIEAVAELVTEPTEGIVEPTETTAELFSDENIPQENKEGESV